MKFLYYSIVASLTLSCINLLPSEMSDREKQQLILQEIRKDRQKREERDLKRALELSRTNVQREGEYKINHAQRHAQADLKQALALSQRQEDYNQRLVDSASMGNIEDVQKYLALGAHVNALVKEDEDDHACTALIEAVEGGHKDIVQLLLENKADANLRTPCCGTTALLEATRNNHKDIESLIRIFGGTAISGHPAHGQRNKPRENNNNQRNQSNGPGAASPARNEAKEECVVCMESVAQSDFRILPCAHKLCKTCHPRIERNREGQRLCPTCRQPF